MNNFSAVATGEFVVICVFSIVIGLILSLIHLIHPNKLNYLSWRNYWLANIFICCLPLLFFILPDMAQVIPTFDFSLLNTGLVSGFDISINQEAVANPSSQLMKNFSHYWLYMYFAGVLFKLIKFTSRSRLVFRIIRESKPLSFVAVPALLDDLAIMANQETGVEILITNKRISPFAFELGGQYIVLPRHLLSELNAEEIGLVLAHEMTHIKHHDNRIMLLTQIIHCFVWFNPFIMYFDKNMNWAAELNCDEAVISNKPNLRKVYAVTMLKTLHNCAKNSSEELVATFSHQNHRSIKMRIKNIIDFSNENFKLNHKKIKLGCFYAIASFSVFVMNPSHGEVSHNNDRMISPLIQYAISSEFGSSKHRKQNHKGIDLKADKGTEIMSIQAGMVLTSTDSIEGKEGYGKTIIIDHGNGIQSLYAHLSERQVEVGDIVESGQVIGYVGSTGKSTGPHLHLELIEGTTHINPALKIDF